jgi:hypothetical protein
MAILVLDALRDNRPWQMGRAQKLLWSSMETRTQNSCDLKKPHARLRLLLVVATYSLLHRWKRRNSSMSGSILSSMRLTT